MVTCGFARTTHQMGVFIALFDGDARRSYLPVGTHTVVTVAIAKVTDCLLMEVLC